MAIVHVAVAVIMDAAQQILIAQRPQHAHQGGLWEFPGGKVEADEDVLSALRREIREELGIIIRQAQPLIKIRHDYTDKSVLLDVWRVSSFEGVPQGMEGQPIKWVPLSQLNAQNFPAANNAIIYTLQQPDRMLITGSFSDEQDFTSRLTAALISDIRLVQLRYKPYCPADKYVRIANLAKSLCDMHGATLLFNNDIRLAQTLNAGVHLGSQAMLQYSARPVSEHQLLSVACHNQAELKHAEQISADIILLSPVKPTSSHPGVPGLGWNLFSDLVAQINTPVYALGGMKIEDIATARAHGAQGIAAISAFWNQS
jgi:8-oxo-dGTP diphosphatase